MKAWATAVVLLLSAHALAGETRIDLDSPGALEKLARENPAHYVKVERILSEAPRMPVPRMQDWIRTSFDARNVTAPFLIRTSLPAQADISFTLDDTRYSARIRLDAPSRATPAQKK
jgi:hypothetical protein